MLPEPEWRNRRMPNCRTLYISGDRSENRRKRFPAAVLRKAGSDRAERLRCVVARPGAPYRAQDMSVFADDVGHPLDKLEQQQISDSYIEKTAQLEIRINQEMERQVFRLSESPMLLS